MKGIQIKVHHSYIKVHLSQLLNILFIRKEFRSRYTTVRSRYTSLHKRTFGSLYTAATIKFRSKYTHFELFRSQYTPFELFRSQYTFQIQVHCWHSLGFRSKLLSAKLFRSRYTEFFRPKSTPFFRSKSQGPIVSSLDVPWYLIQTFRFILS